MFKVFEKFRDRYMWIRLSEIVQVYRMDDDDNYTVIVFKHGGFIYVDESVEEILAAIDGRECEPFSLHGYVSD